MRAGRASQPAVVATAVGVAATALHLLALQAWRPARADLRLFGADTERMATLLAVRTPDGRGHYHLLLQLVGQPTTKVLVALGADRLTAATITVACFGGILAAAVWGIGWRRGLAPLAAVAPAALVTTSAAALVFFAVPESFGIGAACVAVALLLVAGWDDPPSSTAAAVALLVAAAGTTTGAGVVVVALLLAPVSWGTRALAAAKALVVGAALVAVQAAWVGGVPDVAGGDDADYLRPDRWIGLANSARTALVDAWVAPPPATARRAGMVTFLAPAPSPSAAVLLVAAAVVGLWALVAIGCWARRRDLLVQSCTIAVVAHVAWFAVYGDEAFLYAAGLLPLLGTLLAVAATAPRWGRILVPWAATTAVLALAANLHTLRTLVGPLA